jgi:hypothetical protein
VWSAGCSVSRAGSGSSAGSSTKSASVCTSLNVSAQEAHLLGTGEGRAYHRAAEVPEDIGGIAYPWRDDVGRVQFKRSNRTRTQEGIRMKTQAIATVEQGRLTLDKPLDLPDRSRVRLTVEPIADSGNDPVAAWQSLRQRVRERPVYSGRRHFSRDELHERR